MIFFAYATSFSNYRSFASAKRYCEAAATKKMKIFFAESVFERRLAEEPTL